MKRQVTEQEIKEAKRRYLKEWRKKNPERVAEINRRYWEKRVLNSESTEAQNDR